MTKQIKPNTVYYSNLDGDAARVVRELVSALFHQLGEELSSSDSLNFIAATRIPNERELYGTFIKALLNGELKSELGYVATEFQVGRDDSKGRVDFFFNYRKTSFLLELKVARIGLGEEAPGGDEEETDPKVRITKPWLDGVMSQLEQLKVDSLSTCLHQKVVKLPMVIYLYVDWRKSGPRDEWQEAAAVTHEYIVRNLAEHPPEFEYFSVLDEPIRTRKRRSELSDEPNMSLYGFTFVAGTVSSDA